MKKIIALIMSVLMAISLVACGEKEGKSKIETILENGYITFATSPDFAPSEFKDPSTGEVMGTDIEYAKKVAEYISEKYGKDIELKIEEMDFNTCLSAVATNSVDFSLNGYAYTPERAENYIMAGPFAVTHEDSETFQGVLVRKGTKIDTVEDFKGLKVGAQLGSLQYNLANGQLDLDSLESFEAVSNLSQGALMVATNKIDALVTDSGAGELLIASNDALEMAGFKFVTDDGEHSEGNYAVVNIHEEELGALIQEALVAAEEELDYSELRQHYVDVAKELGVDVNE